MLLKTPYDFRYTVGCAYATTCKWIEFCIGEDWNCGPLLYSAVSNIFHQYFHLPFCGMYTIVDMLQCRGRAALRVKAENATVTQWGVDPTNFKGKQPIHFFVVITMMWQWYHPPSLKKRILQLPRLGTYQTALVSFDKPSSCIDSNRRSSSKSQGQNEPPPGCRGSLAPPTKVMHFAGVGSDINVPCLYKGLKLLKVQLALHTWWQPRGWKSHRKFEATTQKVVPFPAWVLCTSRRTWDLKMCC